MILLLSQFSVKFTNALQTIIAYFTFIFNFMNYLALKILLVLGQLGKKKSTCPAIIFPVLYKWYIHVGFPHSRDCCFSLQSHALSLRRAVGGRRLPFDELLQEHRDAKEAYMKAKIESREATAALKAAQAANKSQQPHTIVSSLGKVHNLSSGTTSIVKPNAHLNQSLGKDGKSLSVPVFAVNKVDTVQRPASISSHRLYTSSSHMNVLFQELIPVIMS